MKLKLRYIMKNPPKNQKVMGKKAEVEKTFGGKKRIRKTKRDADDLEKLRLRQVIAESELSLNKIEGRTLLYSMIPTNLINFFYFSTIT